MHKKHFFLLLAFMGASLLAGASTADLDSLHKRAWRLMNNNPDSAEQLGSKLLRQSLEEGNFRYAAKGALLIGYVHDEANRIQAADIRYVESLAYLRMAENRDRELEVNLLILLGRIKQLLDRNEDAFRYYDEALEVCGNCKMESMVLYNTGYTLYTTKAYEEAMQKFFEAHELSVKLENYYRAYNCVNYIGLCHHYLGDYSKAREYYHEILNAEHRLGDNYMKFAGFALHNIAFSYYDEGLHDQALDYYLQALQVKQQLADSSQQFRTLMDLGELMMVKADTQQAIRYLEQAAALFHLKVPHAESFKVFELLDRATFSTDPEKNRQYLKRVMDEWSAQAAQLAAETERQQSQALEGFTRRTEKETSRLTVYWIASLAAAVIIATLSFYLYKRRQRRKHREILKLISEV